MADNFDPALFGGSVSEPAVEPKLTTYYYPATPEDTRAAGLDPRIEGGTQGGAGFSDVDLRQHTLEKYKNKESDYVAVAIAGTPTGKEFPLKVGGQIVNAKNVDTGGGLRPGQIDVATSNPELAKTGTEHGAGFDPAMFGGSTAPVQSSVATAPQPQGGGFDPQAFFEPEPLSATPTPKQNKNDVAGQLGAGIAQAGAAIAKGSSPQPPSNLLQRAMITGAAFVGGLPTKSEAPAIPPTGGLSPQQWADIIYRSTFKLVAPNNLAAQDAFDTTYNALPAKAKATLETPLMGQDQARSFIQAGAQLAGAGAPNLLRFIESTQMGRGVMDTASRAVAGMTSPGAVLSTPALVLPGVAQTWAARQLKDTPTAWGNVQQAIGQYGLLSQQGAAAVSNELVRLGAIGLAALGGKEVTTKLGNMTKAAVKKPPVQPRTPPPLPPSVYDTPSAISAVANRYNPETAGLAKGSSAADAIARGSKMEPEEVATHISSVTSGVLPENLQNATAAVRVEQARLQARSEAAGKYYQVNPNNLDAKLAADNALKDLQDFKNGPTATIKGIWARQGHELQNSVPFDLSSYNGLRDKFLSESGKPLTPAIDKKLTNMANKVAKRGKAYEAAGKDAVDTVLRDTGNTATIDPASFRAKMMKVMRDAPCITRN